MNKIDYANYDFEKYTQIPERSLNGGLYTGEPFKLGKNGEVLHGNIPVIPDTGYMIRNNLLSANPPPGAIYQYPGNIRSGNNFQYMDGIKINKKYNLAGNMMKCNEDAMNKCQCKKCRSEYFKYAYV